jgi:hypothetical protein
VPSDAAEALAAGALRWTSHARRQLLDVVAEIARGGDAGGEVEDAVVVAQV